VLDATPGAIILSSISWAINVSSDKYSETGSAYELYSVIVSVMFVGPIISVSDAGIPHNSDTEVFVILYGYSVGKLIMIIP
jgi:hypothetical protein